MKKKIGIVFGCFIPLHIGHVAMIERSISENDLTVIGVTGHDMDRGRDFVPFLRRVRLMDGIYGKRDEIVLSEVDDRAIGLTGTFSEDAWRTWCGELFRQAGIDPGRKDCDYTWYTAEPDYADKIRTVYPDHAFVVLDRDRIPVSGTEIRKDPDGHAGDIHPDFYQYLLRQGLVGRD